MYQTFYFFKTTTISVKKIATFKRQYLDFIPWFTGLFCQFHISNFYSTACSQVQKYKERLSNDLNKTQSLDTNSQNSEQFALPVESIGSL